MKILICTNHELLRSAIANTQSITVEAEYGDIIIEGSIMTIGHHGPRSENKCPCLYDNEDFKEMQIDTIGISHIDLDTIGCISAILGKKIPDKSFWELAAYVDINGPHMIKNCNTTSLALAKLNAWNAWNEVNEIPYSNQVNDCTDYISNTIQRLTEILYCSIIRLERGEEWEIEQQDLDSTSMLGKSDDLIIRISEKFCNHLYKDGKHVLSYNTQRKTMTLSTISDINCITIMQQAFGSEAGGRPSIAESPRNMIIDKDMAFRYIKLIINIFKELYVPICIKS